MEEERQVNEIEIREGKWRFWAKSQGIDVGYVLLSFNFAEILFVVRSIHSIVSSQSLVLISLWDGWSVSRWRKGGKRVAMERIRSRCRQLWAMPFDMSVCILLDWWN